MNTKPMRVKWTSDEDLQCAILAALGFSTQYIMEQTGLTSSQVSYRLKKGLIKRSDYRNGTSAMAERVVARMIPGKNNIKDTLNLR